MSKKRSLQKPPRPEGVTVAWFVTLVDARRRGDSAREAAARRELNRLGVEVIFREGAR